MRAAVRKQWGSLPGPMPVAVLDPEWDAADEEDAALFALIRESGVVSSHPHTFPPAPGTLHGFHCEADEDAYRRRRAAVREPPRPAPDEAPHVLAIRRARMIGRLREFPHLQHAHASAVRVWDEFEEWGRGHALQRGISNIEWLWRRSRMIAGFKSTADESRSQMQAFLERSPDHAVLFI